MHEIECVQNCVEELEGTRQLCRVHIQALMNMAMNLLEFETDVFTIAP